MWIFSTSDAEVMRVRTEKTAYKLLISYLLRYFLFETPDKSVSDVDIQKLSQNTPFLPLM